MYGEPDRELVVPVGEDQKSHVELSREIVRKFNFHNVVLDSAALVRPENTRAVRAIQVSFDPSLMGGGAMPSAYSVKEIQDLQSRIRKRVADVGFANYLEQLKMLSEFKAKHNPFREFLNEVLVEPQVMLTKTPRIPGTDGRKMSKSYGNFISLSEPDESIRTKSRAMITDPARKRRTDPGNPDICPVYDWHKLFSPPETLKWSAEGCRSAEIGCIECKMAMADNLIKWITPVRILREKYAADPGEVLRILDKGSEKGREVAQKTMARVREAVFNWKEKRTEVNAPRAASQAD
jgi:tryptophanyl-tRNA synthetase